MIVTGMLPRIMSRVVGWAKAHHFYSLEFEERGVSLWAIMRTWEKDTFRQVAVTVTDRFAVDATQELSVLGSVVAALGGSASLVAVSDGSHVLVDTYGEYLGSGYSYKLVEYPVFDLRLMKRCLQKVSSYVFEPLDCPSLPVIVSRRKAVRHTRERWFSAETVASSAVGETAPRATVHISDVFEVGDVQYVEEHEKLGLPCCSRSSPGKSKKR